MHTLISRDEIIEIAFAESRPADELAISEAVIVAAQQKFIRPVLGALFDAMLDGRYPEFLCRYIKMPLAMYVKLLMLPSLSAQAGAMGVVQHRSSGFAQCNTSAQALLAAGLRGNAKALMNSATQYLDANRSLFPEYDSSTNILNRTSLDGHIVL